MQPTEWIAARIPPIVTAQAVCEDGGDGRFRAIQRELENEVSRLLSGAPQPDDRVRVDYDDVQLTFDVDKGAARRWRRSRSRSRSRHTFSRDAEGRDGGEVMIGRTG